MKKLKTLKDIDLCKYFDYCVNPTLKCKEECASQDIMDDLRQEAIKWIKEDIRLTERELPFGVAIQLVNIWKKRFNITEEDLK